jgi:type II secretory pathway component PulM
MNVRGLWAAVLRWYATHSGRDRRVLLGVVGAAVGSLVFVGVIDPLRTYRRHVADEITDGQEELERAVRFLAAADTLRTERDQLRKRLEDARSRLLPGDSGTLGAAALQERANSLAAAHSITVQSTQVMREEAADPFRKVSVRLTLSGELRPFAEFVSALEFGPQQLNIPFVEVSRRGAVAGAKGPRTLSATVELSGYLRGAEKGKKPEGEPTTAEGESPAAEGEAGAPEAAAGPAEGEAAPAPPAAGLAAPSADAPEPPPAAPGMSPPPTVVPPAVTADAPGAVAAPGVPAPAAGPAAVPSVPPPAPTPPAAPENSAAAEPSHPAGMD